MPIKKQQKDTDTTTAQSNEEAKTKGTPGAEETRTRILDAAQCLFAAQGFDATPTKAIAEQAGVPNGLIFYYFPTKKALLEMLIAERNMLPDIQAIVQAPVRRDVHATLVTLAKNYLKALKQHEDLSRIMLREFRSHEDVTKNFKTLREEQLRLIAAYMEESMRVGGIQAGKDVQVMARVFLYNLIFVGLVDPLSNTPRFIEDMVDLLLCGIEGHE
jgi:AcrR family transcriptional regulator